MALNVPGWTKRFAGSGIAHRLEDVRASADGSAGQSARDDLGHGAEVGHDAVLALRAAAREPEAHDDLVHDHEDAVTVGDLPHRFEEARVLDGELSPVRAGRLHDDCGDV